MVYEAEKDAEEDAEEDAEVHAEVERAQQEIAPHQFRMGPLEVASGSRGGNQKGKLLARRTYIIIRHKLTHHFRGGRKLRTARFNAMI